MHFMSYVIKGKMDRNVANSFASLMEDMECAQYIMSVEENPEGAKRCADAAALMFVSRMRPIARHVEVRHKPEMGRITVHIFYQDDEVEIEMSLKTRRGDNV